MYIKKYFSKLFKMMYPSIRHSQYKMITSQYWLSEQITLGCTFAGAVQGQLSKMLTLPPCLYKQKNESLKIAKPRSK